MRNKINKKPTIHLKLRYEQELQDEIRKYRAKRLLSNEIISSDEKAALQLLRRALKAEMQTA